MVAIFGVVLGKELVQFVCKYESAWLSEEVTKYMGNWVGFSELVHLWVALVKWGLWLTTVVYGHNVWRVGRLMFGVVCMKVTLVYAKWETENYQKILMKQFIQMQW